MILFKNYVVITPRKTGTVSLNRTMFYQGAVIINEDVTVAIKEDHFHLTNKALNTNIRPNPHDEEHSLVQTLKKKVVLLVRNPYNRIFSWYHYFVAEKRDKYFKEADLSFHDFILSLSPEYYKHVICLATQYKRIKSDNFLKIENMPEELNKIKASVSLKDMKHLNKNPNINSSNPLLFFNQQTLEYFNTLCKDELLMFDYKKIENV